jgi:putative transposase
MRYQFIFERHVRYSIPNQCRVLEVSRAGYYRWRRHELPKRQHENWELLKRTRALFKLSHGRYGSPRITHALRQEGYPCSRNRIARLMRQDHLHARARRRYCRTTLSDHRKASPNLLNRCFAVALPNTKWTCDITFVRVQQRWLYVATVMDLCTRKIVGLAMRSDMTERLVIEALEQAIARQQPASGLLVHSDRGVQYSSHAYRHLLQQHGFQQSMSRKGNCWDNAPMESFFKTMKVEMVYERTFASKEEAKQAIFEYIEVFYNRQRMHSALNYLTPDAFEALSNQTNHLLLNCESTVY